MDFMEKKDVENPRENASLLSRLFFWWIFPLMNKSSKKDMDLDDIYNVLKEDSSDKLGVEFGKEWEKICIKSKLKGEKPKYYKVLLALFGKYYAFLILGFFFDECVIRVMQPIFLRLLIRSFTDETVTPNQQYYYAAGLCFLSLLHVLVMQPITYSILQIGMKCRIGTCSLIYRKTLRLSKSVQEESSVDVGKLTNLMTNDCRKFDSGFLSRPYIFIAPIQTLIFAYFLWIELGIECLASIGFPFLVVPFQYYVGEFAKKVRVELSEKIDKRGKIMNEILMAIRVIKMCAWEKPFCSLVDQVRREELKTLRRRSYCRTFNMALFVCSKKFLPYLTFLAYILSGHTLWPAKVFYAVSIFDIISQNMMNSFPLAIATIGDTSVTMERVESFLLSEEKQSNKSFTVLSKRNQHFEINAGKDNKGTHTDPFVQMKFVFARWNESNKNLILDNVNLNLIGNKLIMIVGPVGCGKSSLLQAFLQELPISSGKCSVLGEISYCSQEPWIFPGTIRQNILFGKELQTEIYSKVVSICSLQSDFQQLSHGDNTIVGERGITLSGGQKARVNLARALYVLYNEGNIYLLDDPLSAVDSGVSRSIFEECIKKHLDGSLRILVTHQLQYLPQADHVVVMNKGQIQAQGTYIDLLEQGVDLVNLISNDLEINPIRKESTTTLINYDLNPKEISKSRKLSNEKMATGSVSWRMYWDYLRSGNSSIRFFIVFAQFIILQLLCTGTDYWLSYWSDSEGIRGSLLKINSTIPIQTSDSQFQYEYQLLNSSLSHQNWSNVNNVNEYFTNFNISYQTQIILKESQSNSYIWVYSSLILTIIFFNITNLFLWFDYCNRISRSVHNSMFSSVVRAKVNFFDRNPSGRIMNLFTKDLCNIDENLPMAFYDVFTMFLAILATLVIVMFTNYIVIIPTVVFVCIVWNLRRFYMQTARVIKRIEAITKSPMLIHTTASIEGLITIRALNTQTELIKQFDSLQDIHSASWFVLISSNAWFTICLEILSVVFLCIVTFGSLFIANYTNSGYVGLAISSVIGINLRLTWCLKQSAELESQMTSVERCLEYTKIKPEAPLDFGSSKKPLPKGWPELGRITFKQVSLTYDGKKVLQDLSFEINPKERIGICGRTGAGKSSIVTSIFRMTEPSGEICIDGIKTLEIGLHDLRKNISIVPQDPVLFSGTLRYNLDPFGQFEDEELWRVLEDVDLKRGISALDLDMKVNYGGTNFSLGQRQLVCLGRAILRKNKIIIMDEATANVDPRTDRLIQKTIQEKFSDCTIITIAHRLHSVMDCDKILLMEQGFLKEYDHPHILLQNPDSAFSVMARHTGKSSHNFLKDLAASAWNLKHEIILK